MAKILVFQHVAAEPLGILDPMIRERGHRIRYVNFSRDPDMQPDISRYQGLIVLGGPMMPDQTDQYPHLKTEIACIEGALKRDIPVLGICLGSQLLAHTLGAALKPNPVWEIGWYDVMPTESAQSDTVFQHFDAQQKIFQWHGYTFGLPKSATHLARSETCTHQAFRYGNNAYGLQFHLELDQRLIDRWLGLKPYVKELIDSGLDITPQQVHDDAVKYIGASTKLAHQCFESFLNLCGPASPRVALPSR